MMVHGAQSQFQRPPTGAAAAATSGAFAASPSASAPPPPLPMDGFEQPPPATRQKRKAESQDNERLSKRLSLLNIEQNGSKLYVPVESPSAHGAHSASDVSSSETPFKQPGAAADDGDTMRLDDTKHKVYIYDIDDELSSDSDAEDGKLVFLPDIDKHLRQSRIPPHVLAGDDGQLAGMQLVLYSDPKSLTVPEDKDGVRRAIIEARHRLRDKQRRETRGEAPEAGGSEDASGAVVAMGDAPPPEEGDAMDLD